MAVTSYGRNKNHDDEIKKTKRRPIIAPAIAVRLFKTIFNFGKDNPNSNKDYYANNFIHLFYISTLSLNIDETSP